MKENSIETADVFLTSKIGHYNIVHPVDSTKYDYEDILNWLVDYHNYLNSDSEGEKSAEEVLDKYDRYILDQADESLHIIDYDDAIKAMHEFAAQSMPTVTDEDLQKQFPEDTDNMNLNAENLLRRLGAEWARTKLTGK